MNRRASEGAVISNGRPGEPSYELHKAAFYGDLDKLKSLLETGKDPRSPDKHGKESGVASTSGRSWTSVR